MRSKSAKKTKKIAKKEVFTHGDMLETRGQIKELLVFAIDYLAIPITADQVLQQIFEEEKGEIDRQNLLAKFIHHVNEPELIGVLYRLLCHAWLFFPHHFLNGLSPIEVAQLNETKVLGSTASAVSTL
jgi:hypothetical protein